VMSCDATLLVRPTLVLTASTDYPSQEQETCGAGVWTTGPVSFDDCSRRRSALAFHAHLRSVRDRVRGGVFHVGFFNDNVIYVDTRTLELEDPGSDPICATDMRGMSDLGWQMRVRRRRLLPRETPRARRAPGARAARA